MKEKHYSIVLSLCITPETSGYLKALAGEKQVSVSELVRQMIDTGLEIEMLNSTEETREEAVETPA